MIYDLFYDKSSTFHDEITTNNQQNQPFQALLAQSTCVLLFLFKRVGTLRKGETATVGLKQRFLLKIKGSYLRMR